MEEDQGRDCSGDTVAEDRRIDGDAAADSQLSEDEKIEKFYELIRNYKEARDRQRIEQERLIAEEKFECDGNDDDEEEWKKRNRKKMKLVQDREREQPSWIPAFEWEDFNVNASVELRRPLVNFPAANFDDIGRSSTMHGGDVKDPPPVPAEMDGGGLDLRLRL